MTHTGIAALWRMVLALLLLSSTAASAQDARTTFKPGVVAQAVFVAPDIGPSQHADFQVESVNDSRLRGYLIGSEGLCHGRFQVEGRWNDGELVISSPSRYGTIRARLKSAGSHILKGPFTVSGKQGEMTLTIKEP